MENETAVVNVALLCSFTACQIEAEATSHGFNGTGKGHFTLLIWHFGDLMRYIELDILIDHHQTCLLGPDTSIVDP